MEKHREDIVSKLTVHETWNDCPRCGKAWKDDSPNPSVIHRTRLCSECKQKLREHS